MMQKFLSICCNFESVIRKQQYKNALKQGRGSHVILNTYVMALV